MSGPTWQPAEPITEEWLATLRERIDTLKIDPELVRNWLAFECAIVGGKRLLERLDCLQAVLLYRQIDEWHRRPDLYAVRTLETVGKSDLAVAEASESAKLTRVA